MVRIRALVGVALSAAFLAGCAARDLPGTERLLAPRVAPDGGLHVAVEPVARIGPVSGYWQTPRGGAPGSTSLERPTFSEMGVTGSWEVGAAVKLDYGRHRLEASYARQDLSGDTNTLGTDLTSQAAAFPAGTVVESESAIDWAALRYNYLFEIPLSDVDRLELRPGVGYRAAQLHHVLTGSNGARVSRHHGPTMPDLSLDWAWHPRGTGRLRFSGRFTRSLTFPTKGPRSNAVFEATGRAHYDLSARGSIFVETGYRNTRLRDDQPSVQNDLDFEFGPWIGIGGELRL